MIDIVFFWYDRTALLHINLDVIVIIQQNIRTGDIVMNYVLRLKKFDITQHLYSSTQAFESNELKSYLFDYCCHVSLLRMNRCRDDLDQGNWHMLKNDIEVGFEFVSLDAFDEILSLNLKKSREIFTSAWVWELSDRDYFWSWSIFCCSHFRSRAFLLRYRDQAIDPEVIVFVVRAPREFVFHPQRRILPRFRPCWSWKVLMHRLGCECNLGVINVEVSSLFVELVSSVIPFSWYFGRSTLTRRMQIVRERGLRLSSLLLNVRPRRIYRFSIRRVSDIILRDRRTLSISTDRWHIVQRKWVDFTRV